MATSSSSSSRAAAASPKQSSMTMKKAYLLLYNCLSGVAWLLVLVRTLAIVARVGPQPVYAHVGQWTKWTQTMAALEVVHSLLGIVRSPVVTTVMQVASRFLLVWGVVDLFPELGRAPFYTSMLLAWSITEVVRYSYFAVALGGGYSRALTWLRYNTFFVLYPVGILSECSLIFLATTPAAALHPLLPYALYSILAIYVPGSYILYTYMMKQRKKVMRDLKAKDQKAFQ